VVIHSILVDSTSYEVESGKEGVSTYKRNGLGGINIYLYLCSSLNSEVMKKRTDFLVIGSGIAGLTFALKAVKFGKVTIVYQGKS